MSAAVFDDLIHQPHRLRICVLLAGAEELAFQTLCDELELTMPTLSKQLKMLGEAGYVTTRKSVPCGRSTTWVRLAPAGRRALAGHLAALQELLDQAS